MNTVWPVRRPALPDIAARQPPEANLPGRPAAVVDRVDAACLSMQHLIRQLPGSEGLAARARSVTQLLLDAAAADADAARGSIRLIRRTLPYGVRHPLHTALVALVLARHYGLGEAARRSLAGAAVTMNLAMTPLQERLHAQAAPLSIDQRQQLLAHPLASAQLLADAGITDGRWLRIVREHHERLDGSGYPAGLRQADLEIGSRILMFADYFCAKVSPRTYRRGVLPDVALRKIFFKTAAVITRPEARAWIRLLGLYPPGTWVRLANGETAVVVRRGVEPDCPAVLTVLDARRTRLPALLPRNTASASYAIVATLSDDDVGMTLDPHLLWPPHR